MKREDRPNLTSYKDWALEQLRRHHLNPLPTLQPPSLWQSSLAKYPVSLSWASPCWATLYANLSQIKGAADPSPQDALYQHAKFPSIKINGLTTGSRQRPGAMLLFAYTLCGRLYLSLGYDKNAYAEGSVEKFWDALFEGVKEFLLPA